MNDSHVIKARAFAKDRGIPLRAGSERLDHGRPELFESDPARDFGGMLHRVPALVFSPRDLNEAQVLFRFLRSETIPYKLRAAAHSPGGEVLIEGGVVIDISGLRAPLRSTTQDEARISGGARWIQVCESLSVIGRSPLVMTDNPHTSVAGTLSVGGFGDSSHLHGLQIDGVRRAALLLPSGELRQVEREDPLLRYALCGRGQLGLLAEVSLALWRRSRSLHARLLHFSSASDFIESAIQIAEERHFDCLRAWANGYPPHAVTALVGRYGAPLSTSLPTGLRSCAETQPEWLDLQAQWRVQGPPLWPPFNPALEVVLPLPAGQSLLQILDEAARGLGRACFPRGYALLLLRGRTAQSPPLSPLPDSPWALIVALRPECRTRSEAMDAQAQLAQLTQRLVDGGGRIYLTSFPLTETVLQTQYGEHLNQLRALKRSIDPEGLCNGGSFFGLHLS